MPGGRVGAGAGARPSGDGRTQHVLVVDDEATIRDVVAGYLEADGFVVHRAGDGPGALRLLDKHPVELVVLDVVLPGLGGLQVLTRLRRTSDVPVILLTGRGDEADRVIGLEPGADDYVVKPFSVRELAARVRTVLRRGEPRHAGTLAFGGDALVIDLGSREVVVDGRRVATTAREFDLLAFLAASPRQVFSRRQLLRQVWGSSDDYQDPSTVTVHVRRLRQKVEDAPGEPRWITTVWGVGYRFEP